MKKFATKQSIKRSETADSKRPSRAERQGERTIIYRAQLGRTGGARHAGILHRSI